MNQRDLNLTGIVPLHRQAGLPADILWVNPQVGGSLGFRDPRDTGDIWDQLDVEAAEQAQDGPGVAGAPGGAANLRQNLHSFQVMVETTSGLVLPFSKDRIYLMLQNKGASKVFAAFGHTASEADFEVPTGPGFYEPILGTVSSVHMVASSGSQPVTVIEGFRY